MLVPVRGTAAATPTAVRRGALIKFGYTLSCEEHEPRSLIDQAKAAEQAGFDGLRPVLSQATRWWLTGQSWGMTLWVPSHHGSR